MKKMIAVLLTLVMTVAFAACAGNDQTSAPESSSETESGPAQTDGAVDDSEAEGSEAEGSKAEGSETGETKILVAFFSATNTTQGVAEEMADGLGADLYEIVPEEPYTDDDLDYNDDNSRSTIEMDDPSARPAISGSVENMEQYDVVFLGYPKMEQGYICV